MTTQNHVSFLEADNLPMVDRIPSGFLRITGQLVLRLDSRLPVGLSVHLVCGLIP